MRGGDHDASSLSKKFWKGGGGGGERKTSE